MKRCCVCGRKLTERDSYDVRVVKGAYEWRCFECLEVEDEDSASIPEANIGDPVR